MYLKFILYNVVIHVLHLEVPEHVDGQGDAGEEAGDADRQQGHSVLDQGAAHGVTRHDGRGRR